MQCFARRDQQVRVVAVGNTGPRRDITLLSARAIRTESPLMARPSATTSGASTIVWMWLP